MDCGPTNAIQNLAKHSQRDNSLQNQFRGQQQGQSRQFRQGLVSDARINQEFAEFAGSPLGVAPVVPGQVNVPMKQQNVQMNQLQMGQMGQQGWIQDFGNMKLEQRSQANWSLQFQQSPQFQQGQTQQVRQEQLQQMQPQYQRPMQMMGQQPMMNSPQFFNQPNQQPGIKEQDQQFTDKFDEIAKELEGQQHQADDRDLEKDEFSRIAQKINATVNERTAENAELKLKFAQLGFMNLMQRVADREVELQGDNLVDSQTREKVYQEPGERTATAMPDYHEPMHENRLGPQPLPNLTAGQSFINQHQQYEPRPEHQNKLPDPLAHIADGALEGITDPMMMAQIILGGQVQKLAWMNADTDWLEDDDDQFTPKVFTKHTGGRPIAGPRSILTPLEQEIFDDYRHDDDYH